MKNIQKALALAISSLSGEHYEQSLDHFRLWFRIGQKYSQNHSDLIFDAICGSRSKGSWSYGDLFRGHSIGPLIPRFVNDVELDPVFAPYSAGLLSRFCARVVQEFFDNNVETMDTGADLASLAFYVDVNLVACCANLGYIEEDMIRDYILQSLISHSKLHDHQADALAILFKIAGATFEAYVDPTIVDRCFQLLKNHTYKCVYSERIGLIQVGTFSVHKRWN